MILLKHNNCFKKIVVIKINQNSVLYLNIPEIVQMILKCITKLFSYSCDNVKFREVQTSYASLKIKTET